MVWRGVLAKGHLANGHLVNGHLANGHLANKCMGGHLANTDKMSHFNNSFIQFNIRISSIQRAVSDGNITTMWKESKEKFGQNCLLAKCPPCTYWPNVRWPSVRWPNVRWPSVRWPNVRWPSVRWPNGRWSNVPDSFIVIWSLDLVAKPWPQRRLAKWTAPQASHRLQPGFGTGHLP